MSAERKLVPFADTPDAPALGFSLQVDLGAGRVATLQTFVPNDCDLSTLNDMLDKMTKAGDRQRAHYKIEELERELQQLEKEQAQHKEDLATIDEDYAKKQAERLDATDKWNVTLANFSKAKQAEHTASGRRGEVQFQGRDKANVQKLEGSIQGLQEEIAKATAEHDIAHANSSKTMARRQQIIERTKAEIARCQAVYADKG